MESALRREIIIFNGYMCKQENVLESCCQTQTTQETEVTVRAECSPSRLSRCTRAARRGPVEITTRKPSVRPARPPPSPAPFLLAPAGRESPTVWRVTRNHWVMYYSDWTCLANSFDVEKQHRNRGAVGSPGFGHTRRHRILGQSPGAVGLGRLNQRWPSPATSHST